MHREKAEHVQLNYETNCKLKENKKNSFNFFL